MAAITSVLPQLPEELRLPGTGLAAQSLEDWGIWSPGGFTRPYRSHLGWEQGQEEVIFNYMMAGQKSSLAPPPITQPCRGIPIMGSTGGTGADVAAWGWAGWRVPVWEPSSQHPNRAD